MQEYYDLLRSTSRTFAVGIEALPSPLRDAVTLAYLVLRVSDYFEDTPTLTDEEKRDSLELWARLVGTEGDDPDVEQLAGRVAEQDRDLPDRLAALEAGKVREGLLRIPSRFREPIRFHTAATTRGMARWAVRGPDFPHEEALDDYMFEVAGRVGLLLTDLFAAHSRAVARRREELLEVAVAFGLGLQTVNVIRGLHEDPDRGWTYIPRHLLGDGAAPRPPGRGFDPRSLSEGEQKRILDFLAAKAGRHIHDALGYCQLIPRRERGIRIFCIIPALLASRTAELSRRDLRVFREPVKVGRGRVRRIVLLSRTLFFSNRWLEREKRVLTRLAGSPAG
jgi:farnesyl-diphosphate farnesyltransferase